jgi:hypothetical protein
MDNGHAPLEIIRHFATRLIEFIENVDKGNSTKITLCP